MKNTHLHLNPVASLALCALLWSSGGMLIKLVPLNSFCIAGTRSFLGGIVLCVIVRRLPHIAVRDSDGKIIRSSTFNMIAGAVCYAATMLLFVPATKMTTAANAILLQYTNPLYIILFGPLLLGEKNDFIDYGAVIGIMAGMVLLFSDGIGGGSFAGNLLALASGSTYGFTTIFLRRQKDGHPADSLILSHLLTFLFSVPFFILTWNDIKSVSIVTVAALVALGIFQVGIPSALLSLGIAKVPALSSVIITMIEPLMNPVWVALAVKEIPSVRCVCGGFVIMGCIVMHVALKFVKARHNVR